MAEEGDGHPVLRMHMYTPLCIGTASTCGWPGGKTMDIGVQLMLKHINAGGYLRDNWTLDVKVFDTACSAGIGRDESARLLLLPQEERPFAVVGCGCTGCTTAAQPLMNIARMPLISHGATSPSLSDRAKFPNFFRICTPDHEGLRMSLVMFRGLAWTIHAQVYDSLFGEYLVPFVRQMTDDLGMVDVFAGRSIAKMREASPADAQPVVEALVLARTRAVLYMGYDKSLWYLGCAMFKHEVRGAIVAHMGWYLGDWWRMQPDPSPCTIAEMDIAVNYWIAAREPKFTDDSAEVECLPQGVTLKDFVEEYDTRRDELGLEDIILTGAATDSICFLSKIFNTLLEMGYTADEVHNMNESTYATYSSVVQGMRIMGTSGPISFLNNATAFGAGDRINVFSVDQLQDAFYATVAKIDGPNIIFEGMESTMSFYGGKSVADPPAALFPACPFGVYNFVDDVCEGCPFGSDFIETEGSCFCSPGFRANGTECSPCAAGSYSAGFGSDKCDLCDKGMFADSSGLTSCERCPLGTFMPRQGAAACEPCGLRRATKERGADAAEMCVCAEGNSLRNGSTCEACSEGLLCVAGLDPPLQQPGFWAEMEEDTLEYIVWQCRNSRECQGGAIGECAAGREGRCCNNCMTSHRPQDDGSCKLCSSWDVVPAVIVGVVVIAFMIVLLVMVRVDRDNENLELVGISIMATQMFMVLQVLGAFAQIQVQWVDPAKVILDAVQSVSLDLDFINWNCWLPSSDPVSQFAIQLFTFPAWGCTVLLAWLASQLTDTPLSFADVFCLLGTVLFMIFIMLTLTVLLPFQCKSNPNGRTSMAAHPGMVCFESSEHWTLVGMATVGFIVYPATCLAWATWATMNYPAWISSGYGFALIRKYRFLFGRFKAEHYYFGLVVLYRNGLIALLPIVLVSVEEAQIVVFCVLLVCSNLFVARTHPWRTPLANYADTMMLFCISVLLNGMAMLVQVTEDTQRSFGWVLSVMLLLPLVLGLGCVAWGIWRNAHARHRYDVFLSHHKGGAGVLARFLKLELAGIGVCNTFLDVDSLENLDSLFHIVHRQTRNMVVLLSSETLKRMWCAGEIVTAHSNNVHTVPVLCDGFWYPDEAELSTIEDLWTDAELQALAVLGISWDMTKAAYRWLQELPYIELRRFSSETEHSHTVHSIIKLCSHTKAAHISRAPSVSKPEILVTGAVSDPEALAACQVFRIMLQQALRIETAVARTREDVVRAQGTASFLVVLLARNVLRDERFAEIMLAAHERDDAAQMGASMSASMSMGASMTMSATPTMRGVRTIKPLVFVTVNADSSFEFPSKDFYQGLRENGFCGDDVESFISACQALLRILALPFSPLGSVTLLQTEVSEICRRRFGMLEASKITTAAPTLRRGNTHGSLRRSFSLSRLGFVWRWGDEGKVTSVEDEDFVDEESTVVAPKMPPVRQMTVPLPPDHDDYDEDFTDEDLIDDEESTGLALKAPPLRQMTMPLQLSDL